MAHGAQRASGEGEWRRGWPTVLFTTGSLASGVGLYTNTASFFVKPLEAATGWGRAEIALGTTLSQFGLAIVLPFIGLMADRIGVRPVAVTGMIAYGLMCFAMAFVPVSLPAYYTMLLLIALAASGTSTIVMSHLVAERFQRWRGTVLGIAISGPAILLIPVAPVMVRVTNESGWQAGYLMLAGIALLFGLPSALLAIRSHARSHSQSPPDTTQVKPSEAKPAEAKREGMTLGQAARTLDYWMVIAAGILATLPLGGFLNQLSALLSDKGFSVGSVGFLASVYVTAIFVGRTGVGFLLDILPPRLTVILVMSGAGAGALALLSNQPALPLFALAVGLIGLAMGGVGSVKGFFIARLFGLRAYSAIFGTFSTVTVLGFGMGALLFGSIYDRYGDYRLALCLSAGAFIVSGLLYGGVGRSRMRVASQASEVIDAKRGMA